MVVEGDAGGSSGVSTSSFSLTRKLGPLPVWGWCAIAIIGVLAYKHFHPSTDAVSATDSKVDNAVTPDTAAATDTSLTTGSTPDNAGVGSYTNNTSNTQPTPETNAEWKAQALSLVGSLNTWGAYAINNALGAYLGGQPLDSTQLPIINQAIKMAGPPPQPVPVPDNAGTAVTSKATTIAIALITPVPTKDHQLIHMSVAWHLTVDGSALAGTLLVQEMSVGTRNQWVDYSTVRVSGGVGRWDHGTAAPGVRNVRVIPMRNDTTHTGMSNTVSVNLK